MLRNTGVFTTLTTRDWIPKRETAPRTKYLLNEFMVHMPDGISEGCGIWLHVMLHSVLKVQALVRALHTASPCC